MTATSLTRPLVRLATLLLATVLAIATRPSASAAAYAQSKFFIGGWQDPGSTQGQAASDVAALRLATRAQFNLLTSTERNASELFRHSLDVSEAEAYISRLSLDQAEGFERLVVMPHFWGKKSSVPNPEFDPLVAAAVLKGFDEDVMSPEQTEALLGFNIWDEPRYQTGQIPFVKNWFKAIHDNNIARQYAKPRAAMISMDPDCTPTCFPARLDDLVNDPDPLKRPDIVSFNLYPFYEDAQGQLAYPSLYFYWIRSLRNAMPDRSVWITSKLSEHIAGPQCTVENDVCVPGTIRQSIEPDEAMLRFMTFGPIAGGAKGVIWFTYQDGPPDPNACSNHTFAPECLHVAAVDEAGYPTCKHRMLQSIHHYVQQVAGPIAITTQHLGLHHQGPYLADATTDVPPSEHVSQAANRAVSPVEDLGHVALAVGVFRVPNTQEYYLLILNKGLTATGPATISLDGTYHISEGPSPVGYRGGRGFGPLGQSHNFQVSLQGGEGRFYRVSPTTPSGGVRFTAPAGDVSWLPGTTQQVQWTPSSTPVEVRFFPDAVGSNLDELAGPSVQLVASGSSGSASFVVPDAWTNRGRIALIPTSGGFGNAVVSPGTVRIAPAALAPSATMSFASVKCRTDAALWVSDGQAPKLAYRGFRGRVQLSSLDGPSQSWTDVVLGVPGPPTLPNTSGEQPALCHDLAGRLHFIQTATNGSPAWNHRIQQPNGSWSNSSLWKSVDIGVQPILLPSADGVTLICASDYVSSSNVQLMMSRWNPAGWQADESDLFISDSDGARSLSAVRATNGDIFVAFADGPESAPRLNVFRIPVSGAPVRLLAQNAPVLATAIGLNASQQPVVAYVRRLSSGNERVDCREYNGTSFGAIVGVDLNPGFVAGLGMAMNAGAPVLAYTRNGVPVLAERASNGTWARSAAYLTSDADGPVHVAYQSDGTRWMSFLDRDVDALRVVQTIPGGGAKSSGCQGDPGCGSSTIEPSIRQISQNPVSRDGAALLFELRLPRRAALDIELFDIAGRVAASRPKQMVGSGTHRLEWAPKDLRPGVYMLRSRVDGETIGQSRLVMIR